MNSNVRYSRKVWVGLILPPVFFLLAIVAASIWIGATRGGDAQAIAQQVAAATPILLVVVQVAMLLMTAGLLRSDRISWRAIGWAVPSGKSARREILVGLLPGAVLGVLYPTVLSPWMESVQRALGDYVPPGELLSSLGSAIVPFFVANVLLAPFVEESLYRGYALRALSSRYRILPAILLTCVFFGLLHWAGGVWYMVLTGVVAGGLFAGLAVWRKNTVAPYVAHLALNALEFLYIWLWLPRG